MKILLGWLIFRAFGDSFRYDSPLQMVLLAVGFIATVFCVSLAYYAVKQWIQQPSRKQREQEKIDQMFDQMVKDFNEGKK